jgi:predicted transcriptional regulator
MDTERDAAIVAANVEKAMRDAGFNPNSFARKTGIARTTLIRHLEGNDPGFSIPQLAKIASILGTTAETFYQTSELEVSRG